MNSNIVSCYFLSVMRAGRTHISQYITHRETATQVQFINRHDTKNTTDMYDQGSTSWDARKITWRGESHRYDPCLLGIRKCLARFGLALVLLRHISGAIKDQRPNLAPGEWSVPIDRVAFCTNHPWNTPILRPTNTAYHLPPPGEAPLEGPAAADSGAGAGWARAGSVDSSARVGAGCSVGASAIVSPVVIRSEMESDGCQRYKRCREWSFNRHSPASVALATSSPDPVLAIAAVGIGGAIARELSWLMLRQGN